MTLTAMDFKTSKKLVNLKFTIIRELIMEESEKVNKALLTCLNITNDSLELYEKGDLRFSRDFYKYLSYFKNEITELYENIDNTYELNINTLNTKTINSLKNLGSSLLELIWSHGTEIEKVLFMDEIISYYVNNFSDFFADMMKNIIINKLVKNVYFNIEETLKFEFNDSMVESIDWLDRFYLISDKLSLTELSNNQSMLKIS